MRLSIPHNWQGDLIDSLDLKNVFEFYGKLQEDALGGGRSANISLPAKKVFIENQIKKIHSKGIEFNYLVNSTCLDNQELAVRTHRRMHELFGWLARLSVDSVTVSLPYLAGFIRKNYPNFKVSVSTMAGVDTPDGAKYWEDLGASKITLYEVNANRDFELLDKIRKSVKCQLQLIANNACLYNCPLTVSHGLLCSHASQQSHIADNFVIDFYRIFCTYKRLKDPVNFIKADWIRPEDLHHYERIGIDSIKLVNRGMSTRAIKDIALAYSQRRYEGNLIDLFPSPSKNLKFKKLNPLYLLKYFFHPGKVNIFKLFKIKRSFCEPKVFVDNRKLDGFVEKLQDKKCRSSDCHNCKLCDKTAAEVLKMESGTVDKILKEYSEVIEEFVSGKLFRYI